MSLPSGVNPQAAAALADEAEARAFTDMYAAAPPPLRSRLGLRVERIGDATLLFAPGLPSPLFNRAIGLGLGQPTGASEIEAIALAYRRAGCKNWWLHWNAYAQPAELALRLPALGFTVPERRSWAKVLRGTEPAPEIATDLRVAAAGDAEAGAALQAIVQAFEMPAFMGDWLAGLYGRDQWRLYAAMDRDEVVGGAFLFTAGQLGWLGMGSMRASYRRRGGQGALMARRIADAIEAGARCLATETGEPIGDEPNPSLRNMQRCGFTKVASRLNFAGPA